jgi:hypothetical protein
VDTCPTTPLREGPHLVGIRTEAERPKFFAGLKLWTSNRLTAIRETVMTPFETLVNAAGAVVCCAE